MKKKLTTTEKALTAVMVVGTLAMAAAGIAYAQETSEPPADGPTLSYMLRSAVRPLPDCLLWQSTSCEPLVAGAEKPYCTYDMTQSADGTMCLGAACTAQGGKSQTLGMFGEEFKFCGDPE